MHKPSAQIKFRRIKATQIGFFRFSHEYRRNPQLAHRQAVAESIWLYEITKANKLA